MSTIGVEYWISYGKCDGSACCDYDFELITQKEERADLRAKILGINFEDVPELDKAVRRAYREIQKFEMDEYDTDTDEEGDLCIKFPEYCWDGCELEPEELEQAVEDAIRTNDAKYLHAIYRKMILENEDDVDEEDFEDENCNRFWTLLNRKILEYKKPRLKVK